MFLINLLLSQLAISSALARPLVARLDDSSVFNLMIHSNQADNGTVLAAVLGHNDIYSLGSTNNTDAAYWFHVDKLSSSSAGMQWGPIMGEIRDAVHEDTISLRPSTSGNNLMELTIDGPFNNVVTESGTFGFTSRDEMLVVDRTGATVAGKWMVCGPAGGVQVLKWLNGITATKPRECHSVKLVKTVVEQLDPPETTN